MKKLLLSLAILAAPAAQAHHVWLEQDGKEATDDDAGAVQFDLPWRGVYVLETQHVDKTGGQRAGKACASATYVTSLTVTQASGVASVPAGPAITPSPAH